MGLDRRLFNQHSIDEYLTSVLTLMPSNFEEIVEEVLRVVGPEPVCYRWISPTIGVYATYSSGRAVIRSIWQWNGANSYTEYNLQHVHECSVYTGFMGSFRDEPFDRMDVIDLDSQDLFLHSMSGPAKRIYSMGGYSENKYYLHGAQCESKKEWLNVIPDNMSVMWKDLNS